MKNNKATNLDKTIFEMGKTINKLTNNVIKLQLSESKNNERIIELENGIKNCISWVMGHFQDERIKIDTVIVLKIMLEALNNLYSILDKPGE